MKRSKRLYVLLGVLVAVCGLTFAVTKHEEKKEQIKNSDEIILTLAKEDVTALSWKNETTELSFHRDESWLYDEDEAFPVSEEKMDELLGLFEEFGVSFIIEDVDDYGQYGLDDPVCTILLETADASYEIKLGDYSTMDSKRYVSIGDGNVYLVQDDPLNYYDAEIRDMIDHDDLPDFDTISQMQVAGVEDYQIVYEEESHHTYSEDDVYFTERDGRTVPMDTAKVDDYLHAVSSMDLSDYVTYNVTDEELAEYGLDDPELTVTVDYTYADEETKDDVEDTFVLHVARDPKERAEAEEKEADEASKDTEAETGEEITAYARVGESQIVYSITADTYKDLMKASYDDLRHPEVIWADLGTVHQIDVKLDGNDYTITSEGDEDDRTYYYGDEELDLASLNSALSGLTADSFTDEKPSQKEEISLTVYLDHEDFPQVQIALYRYDGTHCLAVVDGKTVSLVQRSQAVDLIEAVNAIVLK